MLVRQGHNQVVALALVLLVLSACSAFPSAQAVVFPGSPQPLDKARDCLLRMFNQTTPRDRKVKHLMPVFVDGLCEHGGVHVTTAYEHGPQLSQSRSKCYFEVCRTERTQLCQSCNGNATWARWLLSR
jgi:hypothetical protein